MKRPCNQPAPFGIALVRSKTGRAFGSLAWIVARRRETPGVIGWGKKPPLVPWQQDRGHASEPMAQSLFPCPTKGLITAADRHLDRSGMMDDWIWKAFKEPSPPVHGRPQPDRGDLGCVKIPLQGHDDGRAIPERASPCHNALGLWMTASPLPGSHAYSARHTGSVRGVRGTGTLTAQGRQAETIARLLLGLMRKARGDPHCLGLSHGSPA